MKIPYNEAASAAVSASLELTEAEYRGFYEIADGGMLKSEVSCGELRIAGDADGTIDGKKPIAVREIGRNFMTCDASCLNTDGDGRVCVKIRK